MLGAAVCASVLIPILVGVGCPPPTGTGIFGLVTDTTNVTVLPPCNPGFACISFTNSTTIPVNVALYRHNGFDAQNKCGSTSSFQCCTNELTGRLSVSLQGATTGECQLCEDLFTAAAWIRRRPIFPD